jgi:hypothetical protein
VSVRTDSWFELAGAGVAEVGADAVAAGLGGFGFLLFVFGEFFVGVGEGIAGGEHRVGAAVLALFLSDLAEFVADLAERCFDGFHFDEQVTHFFKEIVQVKWADDVGKLGGFKWAGVLAAGKLRKDIEDAKAGAFGGGNAGEFAQGYEQRSIDADQGGVGDHEGIFAGFEFGEEQFRVGDDAETPFLGVQNLAQGALAGRVVVEDEDADLLGDWDGGGGTGHVFILALGGWGGIGGGVDWFESGNWPLGQEGR